MRVRNGVLAGREKFDLKMINHFDIKNEFLGEYNLGNIF